MNPTFIDKPIEKVYFTAEEVSEITGLSKGLCYYYKGKARHREGMGNLKRKPGLFTKTELNFIKEQI